MVKVKPIGHIWGLEFNLNVCFSFMAIVPLSAEIYEIPYLTLKIKGQGHGKGQTWWSHLRPWSAIDMFAFRFMAIGPFLAET